MELGVHAAEMLGDGFGADVERLRDLLVGLPLGDQPQHLAFAFRQRLEQVNA